MFRNLNNMQHEKQHPSFIKMLESVYFCISMTHCHKIHCCGLVDTKCCVANCNGNFATRYCKIFICVCCERSIVGILQFNYKELLCSCILQFRLCFGQICGTHNHSKVQYFREKLRCIYQNAFISEFTPTQFPHVIT